MEQAAGAEGDFELESVAGVVQGGAEQGVQLAQPVARGLRVDAELAGGPHGVAAVLEPAQQGLGQGVLLGGAQLA
jgi:hypothetical protein